MIRHPRCRIRRPGGALGALLVAVTVLLALPPGAAHAGGPAAPAKPYYEAPCLDQDGDHIEDFLLSTPETTIDLYLVFDPAGWNPAAVTAQAQAILDAWHSSITIVYAGQWSPYLFLHDVKFGTPKSPPPELQQLLELPGALGARAYRRFVLKTTFINVGMNPRPVHGGGVPLHGGYGGEGSPFAAATPLAPQAPSPAPAPTPVPPALLLYVVDSGVNGHDQYWGIDAAADKPLAPKEARDPGDISPVAHGTFVKQVAWTTLRKGLGGGPLTMAAYADVRVGVGPQAETTTLELTRGFDAIVAHLEWQRQQGLTYRPVINVSYDTDGPIANHDIIYPRPDGPLDPRAAGMTPAPAATPRLESPGPAAGGPPAITPCDTPLFDNVYGVLGTVYDAVLVVGAGNDGQAASFVINELGLSGRVALVVSAVEPLTGIPAAYSCFGNTPDGQPQNGHPDVAALGRAAAEGFNYLLEGTSISAAFTSGLSAALLLQSPRLTADQLYTALVNKGSALPDMGPRWYGKARLTLPWEAHALASLPVAAPGAPPTLLFPGSGERVAVMAAPAGATTVRLFTVAGRLARTLADTEMSPGRHELAFDGRADDGSPLPAGLYFLRATGPAGSSVTKLLIRR